MRASIAVPRGERRTAAIVVAAGVALLSRSAIAADETDEDRVEGSLSMGVEYDANPRRVEDDSAGGDLLGRYYAALRWRPPTSRAGDLQIRLRQGGKLFGRTRGSDVLLGELAVDWSRAIGDHWRPVFRASFKDRLERTSRQDYSRGRAGAGTEFRSGAVRAELTSGWRYFAYRPSPSASSHGPWGRLRLEVDVGAGVVLWSRYSVARLAFPGARFEERNREAGTTVRRDPEGDARHDVRHRVGAGVSYRGPIVASLRYEFSRNLSNSYGRELTRHGGSLEATVPLPWRLFVAARVRLQKTHYEEPLLAGARFTVDEEDRNSVVASLTRAIGDDWEVEVRYRLFIEEFGSESTYRRHTGFAGWSYFF
ncbi:MAG: hypothetical protein ABEL76_00245 [Bradymonadaceae bacterium]